MKRKDTVLAEQNQVYDEALSSLNVTKDGWARLGIAERIDLLQQVKKCLMQQAEGWVEIAARRKRLPAGSSLVGEEWLSGHYAVMAACNGSILTLSQMKSKAFLTGLPTRRLDNGRLAVQVVPHNVLSLRFSMLPHPPWFITIQRQHMLGRLLTHFQYEPSFWKLPRIFINALRG
ncbi:hypothetical protein FX985_02877 [Pseudomonas extremaustralis]|uniref:Uncharacterized protein n=1 Tax=Pseudomonas extremaustralis TaxID=359110 RepID=A0A5M9J1W8_9PSED|nr:hypothetical protein [Pseudomonas extremaustralis]KAA8562811.1 hypothetical protein FX985_02877 [Pseudomonas extremaustralis]